LNIQIAQIFKLVARGSCAIIRSLSFNRQWRHFISGKSRPQKLNLSGEELMHSDSASSQISAATREIITTSAKRRLERVGHSLRLALRPFRGPELPPEIDPKDIGYPTTLTGLSKNSGIHAKEIHSIGTST
jgi:hypothetical protein